MDVRCLLMFSFLIYLIPYLNEEPASLYIWKQLASFMHIFWLSPSLLYKPLDNVMLLWPSRTNGQIKCLASPKLLWNGSRTQPHHAMISNNNSTTRCTLGTTQMSRLLQVLFLFYWEQGKIRAVLKPNRKKETSLGNKGSNCRFLKDNT